jgi:quinoprotein glucose dehydrogenase
MLQRARQNGCSTPKVYENGLGIPADDGWLHRGVAYWRSGDDERVVILTAFAYMIALEAKTGVPIASFGSKGWIDLAQGLRRPFGRDYYTMTSPPVIVRDVIVDGQCPHQSIGADATRQRTRL